MKLKLPWSISTTVRNPERLRSFLQVLIKIEGMTWDDKTQKRYQTLLIQERLYGFGEAQFYNANRQCKGLKKYQIELLESLDPLTYEQAEEIFETKKYVDPAMRGRQSFNPLEKLGLAIIEKGKVKITSLGRYFLKENYDLGEMFFRSFIKWQIPNPSSTDYKEKDGYDIKPFIGTLHLIAKVNQKWASLGKAPVGISKEEFCFFASTLINFCQIDKQAQRIIDLRIDCEGKSNQEQRKLKDKIKVKFAQEFLGTTSHEAVNKLLDKLRDYGDNAIRYFRLTRYLYIRGGGFFVDLEPRRQVEINNLLKHDDAKSIDFSNEEAYLRYLADITRPELPWEKDSELIKIAGVVWQEIELLVKELKRKNIEAPVFVLKDPQKLNKEQLKEYIEQMRNYRKEVNAVKIHYESQEINKIEECIVALKEIYKSERKSVDLERLATLALNALNDALSIKSNYPVGDDNEPTFTAPANKPDIECFYGLFNSVCEVTMLTDRSQWYHEGQPVMRHVRDFEKSYVDKKVFCLFVAPRLHRDTINTFWHAVKYEYEGSKQKIVPLTIGQLIELLEILIQIKKKGQSFKHDAFLDLYAKIVGLTTVVGQSDLWLEKIPETINEWKELTLSKI